MEEVVKRAEGIGLAGLGVTDHDTVDGIPSLIRLCEARHMVAVPGVELSAVMDDADVHILGYFIRYEDGGFRERLAEFQDARVERAREMVDRLAGMGVEVDFELIEELAGEGTIGRPHIALALMRNGAVGSFEEAFARYIGYHGPAYVQKFRLEPEEAIAMIRDVGGFPVLPHPGVLNDDDLVTRVIQLGVMGIEVWHPHHSDDDAAPLVSSESIPRGCPHCHVWNVLCAEIAIGHSLCDEIVEVSGSCGRSVPSGYDPGGYRAHPRGDRRPGGGNGGYLSRWRFLGPQRGLLFFQLHCSYRFVAFCRFAA